MLFGIEFHLMVASFRPKTTSKNALWKHEYCSCLRWAEHAKKEHHLLEAFAHHSTQAPLPTNTEKKSRPTKTTGAEGSSNDQMNSQQARRNLLTSLLNGLVREL